MLKKISKFDLEKFKFYANNGFIDAGLEIPCGCNFNCIHCYRDDIVPDLPYESVLKVLQKLKCMGVVNIYLTGGEVFTYKYFEELYLHVKNEGFVLYILTNGSKIHQHKKILVKYPPAKLIVTIYGTNEQEYKKFVGVSGQFREVTKSLNFLSDKHIPFSLHANITKKNYNEVMNGNYDKLAKFYNKSISYNYLLIPTLTGKTYPLNIQLSESKILEYIHKYGKYNSNTNNQTEFFCKSGKYSITINNCENFTVCLKDRKNLFSAQLETSELVSSIKKRAIEIKEEAEKMKCVNCDINSGCEWCPVQFSFNKEQQHSICRLRHRVVAELSDKGNNNEQN